MGKYNLRSDVPDKYKWDLTDFFKDDNEFEKEYVRCKNLIKETKKYKNCTKDSNKLYEFLKNDINIENLVVNLYVYAMLKHDEDLNVSKYVDLLSKTTKLMSEYNISVSFFKPELLSLEKEEYDNLFKNKDLEEFRFMLDEIYKDKNHVLSEKEETIISMLNTAMNNFSEMSSTMLNSEHDYGEITVDGKKNKIRTTNLRTFLKNKDEKIRKEAYEKHRSTVKRYAGTSASFLNSFVNEVTVESKLRNFKSAWDENLYRNNMPEKAYDVLINTIEKNTKYLQRYYKLMKKVLGKKELNIYDLRLDLTRNEKVYSVEEALDLCKKSVSILGEDYIKHFDKIIDNHYIDFCEYSGKCSGGYSCNTNDHDSRILMSFNDDLDSVSTIIHEGGHNVHHQYVNSNNKMQYRNITELVAEVASLTNECLLSNYLSEHGKNKDEKLSGIANILNVIIANLFDSTMDGSVERDFYNHVLNGNALTKDYMCNLQKDYFKKYFGGSVKDNELAYYNWALISHNYMEFYLFSYAFCMATACYVADKISSGDKEMLDKYLNFLKLGSDVYPIDAIRTLGIDLEDEKVYVNAVKYFDSLITKFEKIYNE